MHRGAVLVLLVGITVAAAAVGATGTQADEPTAEVVARYPGDGGEMVERTVLAPSDVASVDTPRRLTEQWLVSVTLSRDGATSFAAALVDAGFTTRGVAACDADAERNDEGYCLLTVVDGEVVSALGVGESLADALESGAFADDPELLLLAPDERTANRTARAFGWRPGQPDPPWSTPTAPAPETSTRPASPSDGDGTGAAVPGFDVTTAILGTAAAAALARAAA